MKHQPIRSYRPPGYPGRDLYIKHPELLLGHAPQRWLKKGITAGALLAFVGAGSIEVSAVPLQEKPAAVKPANEKANRKLEIKNETVKVAPLFIHGDGTGSTGCVVISPPAFLSEAEAMEIILSEFRKAGIEFNEIGYHIPDVPLAQPEIEYGYNSELRDPMVRKIVHKPRPFVFEAYSSKLNLGFKYISEFNHFDLHRDLVSFISTVHEWDMVELAKVVQESLKTYGRCNATVFYDPMQDRDKDLPMVFISDDIGKSEPTSAELLRSQVQDFLNWFRAELLQKPGETEK